MGHVASKVLLVSLVIVGAVAISLGYFIAAHPLPSRAEDRPESRPEAVLPATAASHCDRLCQEANTVVAEIHFTVEGTAPTGYTCLCLTDNIPVDLE
jgi:hypothetical protein